MSKAVANLDTAQHKAMARRPKVGIPHQAETLHRAGVNRSSWFLPACEGLYLTQGGPVVTQGAALVAGAVAVPSFNRDAFSAAHPSGWGQQLS